MASIGLLVSVRENGVEPVINRVALSRASIYAAIKAGTFPAQKKISARAVRWQESEINAWIDAFA